MGEQVVRSKDLGVRHDCWLPQSGKPGSAAGKTALKPVGSPDLAPPCMPPLERRQCLPVAALGRFSRRWSQVTLVNIEAGVRIDRPFKPRTIRTLGIEFVQLFCLVNRVTSDFDDAPGLGVSR